MNDMAAHSSLPKNCMIVNDFSWKVRVYYEDTDAGGIVFYANYLKFFERSRTEWLRAIGLNQSILVDSHRVLFVVKTATIDYHAPAKLDDELKLIVNVQHVGRASLQFRQQAWRMTNDEPQLLATGHFKLACVSSANIRPCSIPEDILSKIKYGE